MPAAISLAAIWSWMEDIRAGKCGLRNSDCGMERGAKREPDLSLAQPRLTSGRASFQSACPQLSAFRIRPQMFVSWVIALISVGRHGFQQLDARIKAQSLFHTSDPMLLIDVCKIGSSDRSAAGPPTISPARRCSIFRELVRYRQSEMRFVRWLREVYRRADANPAE